MLFRLDEPTPLQTIDDSPAFEPGDIERLRDLSLRANSRLRKKLFALADENYVCLLSWGFLNKDTLRITYEESSCGCPRVKTIEAPVTWLTEE